MFQPIKYWRGQAGNGVVGRGNHGPLIFDADIRVSSFALPDLEEITANALLDTGALDFVIPEHLAIAPLRFKAALTRSGCFEVSRKAEADLPVYFTGAAGT